ncbi:uncharacterized protein LODBEIA_P51870 [Lodderomyces beijingensis]|uniref:ubiquitinyl hydrolase 1 n=1 Tax=Lodderomyces beijingensis TaxID=1775926 RepID=A0ABP0ZS52_9ASCO
MTHPLTHTGYSGSAPKKLSPPPIPPPHHDYHTTTTNTTTRYTPRTSSSISPDNARDATLQNGRRQMGSNSSVQVSSLPHTSHNSTPMQESSSTNSLITEEDIKYYYTKLINYELRNLQLDTDLQCKSLFDLIDYCEMLYETSNVQLGGNVHNAAADQVQGIKTYIKGFLVFNYFINSFIMLHFEGFDEFIKVNEQDFIIYLNIYAFYNSDVYFNNGKYSVHSIDLRKYVKLYLVDKDLLNFNIEELYEWLNEYIRYLKSKDEGDDDNSFISEEERESEFETIMDDDLSFAASAYPPSKGANHSRAASVGSIDKFKVRYPSLNLNANPSSFSSLSENAPLQKIRPPIPTVLPPSLQTSKTTSFAPSLHHETPYPVSESNDSRNANHRRPKQEVPEGYSRPTQRQTAPVPHKNGHTIYHHQNGSQSHHPQLYNYPQQAYQQQQPQYQQSYQPMSMSMSMPMQPDHGYSYSNGAPPVAYQQYLTQPPPHPQLQPQAQQPQLFMYQPHNNLIPTHVLKQQEQIKSQKINMLKDYSVCGLRNFGSSCYINSTIQILFGIYSFKTIFNRGYQKYVRQPEYVKIMKKPNSHHKESILLSEAIAGLLRTFQQNGGVSVSPSKFIRVTSLLKPDFNIPHEQQDAQEFLLFLLERLHEELCDKTVEDYDPEELFAKWNITVNLENRSTYYKWCRSLHEHEGSSPISDLFQGHLQNKLKCNKCGYESISYSPFSILSLPIPNTRHPDEIVDLSSCLGYYIQDETLAGDNAWRCPKCHGEVPTVENHPVFASKKGLFRLGKSKKQPTLSNSNESSSAAASTTISTKSLHFVKLPTILFIHLSRFSMMNLTHKLDTPIRYPLKLKFNNQGHEIIYKITGIINHFGNLKSGHYTSLINKSTLNETRHDLENLMHPFWCYFDDEHVRPNVNNGSLRGDGSGYDEVISKDVYVLCYERVS